MNILVIDPQNKLSNTFSNFFFGDEVDYNTIHEKKYDVTFIECDVCKLGEDISWSHWVRLDDSGEPKLELKDEYLVTRRWGTKERYSSVYRKIYESLSSVKTNKVVFVDLNDRAIVSDGIKWLDENGYRVDIVLKREFRRTHRWDYDSRIKPFPFLTFEPNASNHLYDSFVRKESVGNGCFFIGNALLRVELGMPDEWVNRHDMLIAMKRLGCLEWYRDRLSKDEYMNLYNKHKCFLHLNGTGHLCNRFFEGIGKDCLCVMQDHDVIFPMGSPIHPSLIFKTPEQASDIITRINSDTKYYDMCIDYQRQMVEKWFNRQSIGEYIRKLLNEI